jgi:hypothetical protein
MFECHLQWIAIWYKDDTRIGAMMATQKPTPRTTKPSRGKASLVIAKAATAGTIQMAAEAIAPIERRKAKARQKPTIVSSEMIGNRREATSNVRDTRPVLSQIHEMRQGTMQSRQKEPIRRITNDSDVAISESKGIAGFLVADGLGFMGERLGSGDGERKTLLTRQIAFEPLPASVLFALVLMVSAHVGWWCRERQTVGERPAQNSFRLCQAALLAGRRKGRNSSGERSVWPQTFWMASRIPIVANSRV